jgi:hypothetical protein
MNPYGLIAPTLAIALVAGFAFITDASIAAKVVIAALLLLSFLIGGHSLLWGLAGTLLQAALCIGILVYFRVAR